MIESDFFLKLNINSTVGQAILLKAKAADDSKWTTVLDQNLFELGIEDFKNDSAIYKLIESLGCYNRLSVLRFSPNVCFQWHKDRSRGSAINMLLEGFDSFCAFGVPSKGNKVSDLTRLYHEPNTYYLMDVKKFHTVFNFSAERYIISIGIEQSYDEVISYLNDNQMLN